VNLFLCLCLLASAPPEQIKSMPTEVDDKPLMFGISLPVAQDAKIHVESLFPVGKEKVKILSKAEFRSSVKAILYHEYKITKIVVDGMEIKEIHFRLPKPSEYKQEAAPDSRDIVRANATKP
jgi:hypothetical protein